MANGVRVVSFKVRMSEDPSEDVSGSYHDTFFLSLGEDGLKLEVDDDVFKKAWEGIASLAKEMAWRERCPYYTKEEPK